MKADESQAWSDQDIGQAFGCSLSVVGSVKKRFVEEGLEASLIRKAQARPSRSPILDGEKEARLIALACSKPVEGRASWTLQLLADQMISLNIVESISYETVRVALKKTNCGRILPTKSKRALIGNSPSQMPGQSSNGSILGIKADEESAAPGGAPNPHRTSL